MKGRSLEQQPALHLVHLDLIHRSAWNRYSRKFAVASDPPSSAARAQERHGGTVLGSKRTYQVAFVAPLCIKGLRLVTLQLPEKFPSHRTGADRTSQRRRSNSGIHKY